MRKSFVALALLVGAATMWTGPAFAQESGSQDLGPALMKKQLKVTKAARLGTSAAVDTMFVGHKAGAYNASNNPWSIGVGPARADLNYDGCWDFDLLTNGPGSDSLQGWVPYALPIPNPPAASNIADNLRPEACLDWGNRMNAGPIQGHTPGVVSAWHADNGVYPVYPVVPATDGSRTVSWTPLAGSMSAWCGLRAGDDFSVVDAVANGGTGNHINGETVFGRFGSSAGTTGLQGGKNCISNFPGYASSWDQLLYRDVRVADGNGLTVAFLYETQMDNRKDTGIGTCKGWFDRDPLNMQQGGSGYGANNFISASVNINNAPIDSFMVYVGVPTDPAHCTYTDMIPSDPKRPIWDLKRRWFSEVISIDKPYKEILSTFGKDSVYRSAQFSAVVDNAVIQPMINAQGTGNGGGVIRIVFRTKTNSAFSDETNTGGSFVSTNQGAVRIDKVDITGCTPLFTTSGFETAGEINNTIEPPTTGATVGPDVGEGYALLAWHATGKPPKLMAHVHPLTGDVSRNYDPLNYADLCGVWNSPARACDINGVILSTTDHDLFEAAGGADGTAFKDNQGGAMSPTINLKTPAMPGVNNMGLDARHVTTAKPWIITWDMYTGLFANLYTQGNLYQLTLRSYPTLQKNGAQVWGGLGVLGTVSWWGDRYCWKLSKEVSAQINTSNANGIPDSVQIVMFRQQRSIQFGTGASSTDGHYSDNLSLAFVPSPSGSGNDNVFADIWDWYSDAFPRNETSGLTGTAGFDTCGALIFTARQVATTSTTSNRANISADSMWLQASVGSSDPTRLDCIFRVFPGPGNYMIIGDKTSAMRKVPSVADAAVAGDASFWGQYMATPGEYSKGVHAANRWNVDTWNSIRCDTAETNIFPADGNVTNLPNVRDKHWASMIHDDDPRLGTVLSPKLGIPKNRCFLINPGAGQPTNSTNITCDIALVPPGTYGAAQGYDVTTLGKTVEYTKVFPDGLLTPGSSIQYFFRMGPVGGAVAGPFVMTPDTNMVFVQPSGSQNFDGMRWASILILPDKWKDETYGGLGKACMLVVDLQDGRGNERFWVGIADSIGATVAAKYGAHNGWHAQAGYLASDGSNNYTNETNCGTDPNIRVWPNGGQPGTTWDLYNAVSAESPTGSTTQFGGRLAPLATGLQLGKDTKQGPTARMVNDYYESLFFLCGDMVGAFFGKTVGVGADCIALTENFLLDTRGGSINRGVWFMGDGFIEGNEYKDAASYAQSGDFVYNWLGVYGSPTNYYSVALCDLSDVKVDLLPTAITSATGTPYSLRNPCTTTHEVNSLDLIGVTASFYGNHLGACTALTPCISGIYTAVTEQHPYFTLVDGWDLRNLFSQDGGSSLGRLGYFMDISTNVFASTCGFMGTPTVDVPTNTAVNTNIDFMGNVWNNPVKVGGNAIVNFGLAKGDLVDVKVYDVTGRLVKTLASRQAFKAGPNKLVWDGRNDQGQAVSRGVYFTQVKFINSGFEDAKKVTVLK